MGDLTIVNLESKEEGNVLPLVFNASADGSIEGNLLTVRADATEEVRCNLVGKLQTPVSITADQIFALELDNTSNEKLSNNIVLYDSQEGAVSRYLQEIMPGKNLLVFSLIGFSGYGQAPIKDLSTMNLRIYTSGMRSEQVEISLGNVYAFDNSLELWKYCSEKEYKINWGA